MIKVFEFIYTHPKESILFFVISSSLVYTALRICKGFFSLCIKGKKRKEQAKQRELQAEKVIEKLGGIENFTEVVASKVVERMQPNMQELKAKLETIKTLDKCPVELKAYIETVLKTSPNIMLQYEELKQKYKASYMRKIEEVERKRKQEKEEEKRDNAEEKERQNIAKQEEQEEISYV